MKTGIEPFGHIDMSERSAAMDEESIGPGWAGQGREPLITDQEILCQRVKDREVTEREIIHYLLPLGPRRVRVLRGVISDEASATVLHLTQNIVEVMTEIVDDSPAGRGLLLIGRSSIGIVVRSGMDGVDTVDIGIDRFQAAEHSIEGLVLQHENHDMLDRITRR